MKEDASERSHLLTDCRAQVFIIDLSAELLLVRTIAEVESTVWDTTGINISLVGQKDGEASIQHAPTSQLYI